MTNEEIVKLNKVARNVADELKLIGGAMEGKGVSPVAAPLVQAKLREIENKIRQLGGNPANPIPF